MSAVISGWAWRTPLGAAVDDVIARLLGGESAARANPRFDASSYDCRVAAVIGGEPRTSKQRRYLRRMGLHAMDAAVEAFAHAGVRGGDRLGVFFGVGGLRAYWDELMPVLAAQRDDAGESWQRGLRTLHPFWMLQHLSNNAHALLSIELGARGEGVTFGGANAGVQALACAIAALDEGAIDAAVVAAYDSLVEPETITELAARGAVTRAATDAIVAPYADQSAGFVPGEAAAAIVLERNGSGSFQIDAADGAAALRRLARDDVAFVDGAALAQPARDAAERAATAAHVGHVPLTAISSALGHLGAATGIVQAIALAELLRRGVAPPITGLAAATPGPLAPIVAAPRAIAGRAAIALSAGAPDLHGAIRVTYTGPHD